MELMIIVILAALLTALAAPRITQAVANNSVADAANQALIIFRTARTKATVENVAMGVFVTAAAGTQIIRLDRSTDATCTTLAGLGCGTDPTAYNRTTCGVEWIDFRESHWTRHGVRINRVANSAGANISPLSLCVLPSGALYRLNGGVWARIMTPIEVAIDRTDDGTNPASVVRRVLVSNQAFPRLML